MNNAFGTFILISVLAQFVSARGKCTLVTGAYDRTSGPSVGCEYRYSIEFCPQHRSTHPNEQLNSITVEVMSNMTKAGFPSTCALHNKVFSSVVRDDFKRAVTATRVLNMTTMEGTFRSSMLYSVADMNANAPMLFSLHNNHNNHERAFYTPMTVAFQADRNTGAVSFIGPFLNVTDDPEVTELGSQSHHISSEEKKATSDHTKCDFNKLLSGQWNFDANNRTWHWKTHTCDAELITVDAFVNWCKKYELKSLLFFGSSRTRTMLYDILLFIGYTLEEVQPAKPHHHLTYHVLDKLGYDLTLHLHWLDNRPDIDKDQKQSSYNNVMTDMKLHFAEMNMCTHHSNMSFNPEDGYHRPSNVNYTADEYKRNANDSQPYAVIFTIGVYEAWMSGVETFKTLGPGLVQFAYEICMGTISEFSCRPLLDSNTTPSDKNLFFVRLEEAVDPAIRVHDALNQVNDFMYRAIVPQLNAVLHARNMPLIMLLDSHHISRGWKLWKTDRDDLHYYNAEPGTFHGNHVSTTMGRIVLQQVAQILEKRLRGGHIAAPVEVPRRDEVHSHTFPSYNALPEFHFDSITSSEGDF